MEGHEISRLDKRGLESPQPVQRLPLNEELRQQVIEVLRRGEDLPAEWARELFPPERREYELVYQGKEREEDILADTMAVPLQPVSTFGKNGVSHQNMLIFGDNLQAMKTLLRMKEDGHLTNSDGSAGVRLVYIDPPFATKQEFRGTQDQKAYQDKLAGARFIEFLRKRLLLLRELLSDDGAIYVHLDWKKVHYVKVVMDELLGEHGFRNHIIWHYPGREMHITTKFNSKYDSLLFYAKSEATKVRMGDVAIPYDRAERLKGLRRKVHTDKDGTEWVWETRGQSAGQEPYKRTVDDIIQQGRPLSDVWDDLQFLRGNHPERTGYPTQKPSWLLERVIRASSDKGDIVLDCFAGSGTACAVAERLGRRWIAIDCGKLAIYTIQKRMLNLHIESGRPTFKLKPFTLYNAGLYDFSTLRKLPWRDWRFFALQLFGCKDEPHTIGGLCLDGKLKGASVLVFNHLDQPGHRIDEDTILGIHSAIGGRIGRKFFIIAPRGVFDFQQDYIDLEGVRYYALRIPYSIINELHQREFTALQQPHDEMSVNDTVDAVGFDFIQPPKVDWTLSVVKREGQSQACLKIRSFRSTARLRGRETKGDLETMSMLMVDLDYNGEVFNMGAVFYAQQLSDSEWSAWLPMATLGKTLMVVFIDIYGNEAREVIETGPALRPKANGKKRRK